MPEPQVLDSWEDEDIEEEQTNGTESTITPPITAKQKKTSMEQQAADEFHFQFNGESNVLAATRQSTDTRPAKTDAVARRMIAGALGIRTPIKTDEQRIYDKAVKEKELKRRNAERETLIKAQEEAERQRAAIWSD
jgi:hypothetical protein